MDTEAKVAPRKLTQEQKDAIDDLAARLFDSTGDSMAVSHSIRNVVLARLEWIAKYGKSSGD